LGIVAVLLLFWGISNIFGDDEPADTPATTARPRATSGQATAKPATISDQPPCPSISPRPPASESGAAEGTNRALGVP
jgi:hypothetical protein